MNVMILAAGKSTRLGSLGRRTPKPMLVLGVRPVLEWTLLRLRSAGIRDVVVNLHHAPETITGRFGDGEALGLRIHYSRESEPLGTAGAVGHVRARFAGEPLLVVYGDNVLDWDVRPMLAEHARHRPQATIAVAEIPDPSKSGVVQFGPDGVVTGFHEKPGHRPELGRWVNAGVYVIEPSVVDVIPAGFSDFGYDVFPELLRQGGALRVFCLHRPPLAIDTPEQYANAQHVWASRLVPSTEAPSP